MKKRGWCLGFFAAVLMLLPPVMARAGSTIKLGVTEPLSGTFRDIGEQYLAGVRYAVKVINENGGLLGKKVEIIPIDSEMKPAVAARKAQELILRDNVRFFCGGTGSSVGAAMSELARRQNAIMISYGMDAASLTGSMCNRHFFRTSGNTTGRSYAMANIVAKKGYKRIAIIAQDYSFGHEAVAAFKKKIHQLDPSAKIVAEIYHPVGTKDFAPYISQLIAAKPDIIFTSNWGSDLSLLLKQSKPMGLKAKFICYYINDKVMVEGLGNDNLVLGDIGVEVYMVSIPTAKNRAFIKAFHKAEGYYPTCMPGKSYMATMFWAKAVRKAGSTKVNDVIKAWEGLTYDGPAGPMTMRACDHQSQDPYWTAVMVKKNPYFKHAFMGPATMIPVKDVAVPCDETDCRMVK